MFTVTNNKPLQEVEVMKVKTLLRTLRSVDVVLMAESGWTKENVFVDQFGYFNSRFEDAKVVTITTVVNCDKLFVTIKD